MIIITRDHLFNTPTQYKYEQKRILDIMVVNCNLSLNRSLNNWHATLDNNKALATFSTDVIQAFNSISST